MNARKNMLMLGVLAATFNAEIAITNNIVPITCRHFTDSAFLISALIAFKRLFGAIVQPWASWKSDRVTTPFGRRRPFLLVGLPGAAIGLLAMGLLPVFVTSDSARHSGLAFASLFLIVCILQVAVDLNWGVLEPLYADTFPQRQLGRASSIRQVASQLVTLFMVTYVVGWADKDELSPYLFAFSAFLVGLLIAYFGIHESNADARPISKPADYRFTDQIRAFVTSRDLLILTIVCTANLALPAAISLLMPLFVTDTLGLSMKDLGITQTLGVFLSVLLSFPMGLLIDQFGPKWVMSSGFAIYAIAALCFTCSFDYLSLSVAMTLFGIAQIAALLPMTAMVFQYCAPDQRGQIFSFVQFVRAFSAFLISLLLGSIVQLSPSYEPTPFYPSDIKEIAGLESDLLSPKNDAARYIRDHLSKESNMLLSQPPSDALRISLIADLNKLLKEPVLYTPARFQLIFLSQQSRQLIEQPTPNSSEGSIVSNRVLIQDIFPNELSKKFNYRLPFEVSLIVALIAMVAALISRPGKFTKSS